ncbi:MAG: hypothetical protein L0J70_05600 [Corynebacterium sp.]|nr:hypothetical protein [Corynebacterium sp.]
MTAAEDLRVLGLVEGEDGSGVGDLAQVPFRVLEGLPDGGVLSEERASRTLTGR